MSDFLLNISIVAAAIMAAILLSIGRQHGMSWPKAATLAFAGPALVALLTITGSAILWEMTR